MTVGDIGAVADSFEFDPADCVTPVMIHISGDVYAIAYQGVNYDGFLVTVTIAADGQIAEPVIDSFEFDPAQCSSPRIIHISGNIYCILYAGSGGSGILRTIEIATTGQITEPYVDTYTLPFFSGDHADIIHISGNIYAFLHADNFVDGWVKTVEIAANGTITKSIIDSLEFGTTDGKYCKIVNVSGAVYAVVFTDSGSDCWVATFSISTVGEISNSLTDSYKFHTGTFGDTELIKIDGNVFAAVYSDVNNDAWITTIGINALGAITEPYIDRYCFETAQGIYPFIVHVAGNIYAIVYGGGLTGTCIKTVTIAANGQIAEPFIDSGDFTNVVYYYPFLVHVAGNIYACAYTSVLNDGFLTTIEIETTTPGRAIHLPMLGIG